MMTHICAICDEYMLVLTIQLLQEQLTASDHMLIMYIPMLMIYKYKLLHVYYIYTYIYTVMSNSFKYKSCNSV